MDVHDFDACYSAVCSRDRRFDGRFVTGVLSTGIFCRPSCPARTPGRERVRFFPTPAAAQATGLRACRRCRPEMAPDVADPTVELASRALRAIDAGGGDDGGAGLAARLHTSERHLRRVLTRTYGAGPTALVRMRRVRLARMLVDQTDLPLARVAFAAGFGSVRQFNDAFREAFRTTPTEVRRGRSRVGVGIGGAVAGAPQPDAGGGAPSLTLRLGLPAPYDTSWVLGWIDLHGVEGVDSVDGGRWTGRTATGTAVGCGPAAGVLTVEVGDDPQQGTSGVRAAVALARHVFDVDADITAISTALGADPVLGPLVRAAPGLRIPGSSDPYGGAVRTVVGQQVSAAAAATFMGRLSSLTGGRGLPAPGDLRHAPLEAAVGLTRQRATAVRALAAAIDDGLDLSPDADPDHVSRDLLALPGIGPWTASTILLLVLRQPDAWPRGDVALRRAIVSLTGVEHDAVAVDRVAERWRPWRGYAAMWLWHHHLAATGRAWWPFAPGQGPGPGARGATRPGPVDPKVTP